MTPNYLDKKAVKNMHWYCYMCGSTIDPKFFILWSLNERIAGVSAYNRVFLACSDECINRGVDPDVRIYAQELPNPTLEQEGQ